MLPCIIDWFEFTLFNLDVNEVISQILQLPTEDFIKLPHGRFGYKEAKYLSDITILFNGNDNMGIHVVMSGKGCRYYEVENDLLALNERVKRGGGQVTRIDLAVDDRTGQIIQFDKIKTDIEKGNYVSRWRSNSIITKRTDYVLSGETIYFGSRQSDICLRFYKKGLEQQQEGSNWVRMELEVKRKKAAALSQVLHNDIGRTYQKLLNNYLRFVTPSEDTNRSRWPTAAYWKNFINEVDKMQLTTKPEVRTVEQVKDWVEKQVGPSLAVMVMAAGGDIGDILEIITKSKVRLRNRHYQILGGLQYV